MNANDQRIAVVTGASSGIGLAAAEELARRGWTLAIVGRDEARLAAATERVRAAATAPVDAYQCDFGVLDDVRALAAKIRSNYPRIDVLANNAGGTVKAHRLSVDGHEMTAQTNLLAPFLLSHELRGLLAGGRIVNTASNGYPQGRLDPDDLSGAGKPYRPLFAYCTAKQAIMLFSVAAARRWPEITSASFHPGTVRTRFGNEHASFAIAFRFLPGLRTPAQGAETLVWLATAEQQLNNGAYYVDKQVKVPALKARDPELAARLWRTCLAAVGLPEEMPAGPQ